MEGYRSGNNGSDSKSAEDASPTWVRIPPLPLVSKRVGFLPRDEGILGFNQEFSVLECGVRTARFKNQTSRSIISGRKARPSGVVTFL